VINFNRSFLGLSFLNVTLKKSENRSTFSEVIVKTKGVYFSETRGITLVVSVLPVIIECEVVHL